MKRIILGILIIALMLSACQGEGTTGAIKGENEKVESKEKIQVVSTIYAGYDWARELTKELDNYEITYLLDNGADLHSYQPSVEEIKKLVDADVVIYAGGVSDNWVDQAIEENAKDDREVINMVESIGDRARMMEIKEGMEETPHNHDHDHEHEHEHEEEDAEHNHDHDHDHEHEEDAEHNHDHDHDHEHEEDAEHNHDHDHDHDHAHIDEHVWLSLINADMIIKDLEEALVKIDKENAETIKDNSNNYRESLKELNNDFQNIVDGSEVDTVVFGGRFPFRYLMDDYGLDYFAAFDGCSAEIEASFETIIFLSNKMNELDQDYIYMMERDPKDIAETIIQNAGREGEILELNSLQSVNKDDIKAGLTYYSAMKDNLEVLKKGLK